jgi:hypothetical protein
MRGVIERHGHSIDDGGWIHYDDRPATYERAEQLSGRKLDRRKNYAIIDGGVCESIHFTRECSGCDSSGCDECGYQGVVRDGHWVPLPCSPPTVSGES